MDLTKFAKIAKNRKSDDFLRYLRFITVICHVNVHFYRVHDHLKQSRLPILPNLLKVRKVSALRAILTFPFPHMYTQEATQPIFQSEGLLSKGSS